MTKTTTTRIDPPSRPADGARPDALRNADPDRHYVLANPNDVYCGLDYMIGLGYVVEERRKNGPHFAGVHSAVEGGQVTRAGQVLVSCPMGEHLQRYNEGQRRTDAVAINIRKHGDPDGVHKGPTGRPAYWQEDPSEHVVRS